MSDVSALDDAMSGPDPDWDDEPTAAVDAEQADRWMTRLAVLARRDAQTRILAQLRRETVDRWETEQLERTARQREWLVVSLRGYHAALLAEDPRAKTVHLPSGTLTARAQQPVWEFGPEFTAWATVAAPELLRVPPPPEPQPDKAAVKRALTVVDGRAVTADGEFAPGVTVTERGVSFTAQPSEDL